MKKIFVGMVVLGLFSTFVGVVSAEDSPCPVGQMLVAGVCEPTPAATTCTPPEMLVAGVCQQPSDSTLDTTTQDKLDTTTKAQSAQSKIINPLKGVKSLGGFFYLIANFVYSLSYAVIALFLILSGFKFVAAQGKPDKLQDAKKTLYYTIIGAVLLIGAQVITKVVENIIKQFTNI